MIVYLALNVPFGLSDYYGWMQDYKLYRNESSLRRVENYYRNDY